MSLTIKHLRALFESLPDNSTVRGYEGEVTGLVVEDRDGKQTHFIDNDGEYTEGFK